MSLAIGKPLLFYAYGPRALAGLWHYDNDILKNYNAIVENYNAIL